MINNLIISTLNSLNIPVSFQKYNGSETTYITFFEYLEQGELFCDDGEFTTGHYIQIDLWSKSDYTSILNQIKANLNNAEFKRISEHDLYEYDTQIYHRVIRYFKEV